MGIVEATLILTVAALYLSIVTGRIGANQLVSNVQLCSGPLKERDQLTVGLCKAIGKLKTIVSLDTFDGEAVLFGATLYAIRIFVCCAIRYFYHLVMT